MGAPRLAYVLLWFPKPSETFVFREVATLWALGMDLRVFTLYGRLSRSLTREMRSVDGRVERIGLPGLRHLARDLAWGYRRHPGLTRRLVGTVLCRRPKGWEKTGENAWALLCAFRLARRFLEEGVTHIHAPWASGPATAAWLAARLTGTPFSFTARAGDIYPADNLLREKIAQAEFVRSETYAAIGYLQRLSGCPPEKFRLTYNGVTLQTARKAPVAMRPPYRLLALGRFVGKKGYRHLLDACRLLRADGLDIRLTLAGDGPEMGRLKRMSAALGLEGTVVFPGFVPHDRVSALFQQADVFVMPSVVHATGDRDGIPLVLMEALMHRVPVVATEVAGIPELIQDHHTGRLVPEKNPAALAAAVRALLTDRAWALELAECGRRRVLERFDPQANYRRVFDLFMRCHRPVAS
jgi:colanic acid/amylovoran biosynthesis glycosyltransferase